MSAALQAKLLRVLEQGEIMRVGGDRSIAVDVRVVAATNRNLHQAMAQGSFRSDLYYRLNVVSLEIPSLRERPEDIPHLIRHFVEMKTKDLGLPERSLSGAVIDRLISYGWPGNVRELENVIERMLVLSPIDAQVIGPDQLPSDLVDGPGVTVAVREEVLTGSKSLSEAVDEFERDIIGEALNRTHYNQTRAANVLGTTRRILKYRMDKLGIDGDPIL